MQKRLDLWKKAAANGHEIASHSDSHPCTANYTFSRNNALEDYSLSKMEKEFDRHHGDPRAHDGNQARHVRVPCGQKFVGRGADEELCSAGRQAVPGQPRLWDESANDPTVVDLAQILGVESDGLSSIR